MHASDKQSLLPVIAYFLAIILNYRHITILVIFYTNYSLCLAPIFTFFNPGRRKDRLCPVQFSSFGKQLGLSKPPVF